MRLSIKAIRRIQAILLEIEKLTGEVDAIYEQIDGLQFEMQELMSEGPSTGPTLGKRKAGRPRKKASRKGQMSAEGRAAIAAAQKKRWAKVKRAKK